MPAYAERISALSGGYHKMCAITTQGWGGLSRRTPWCQGMRQAGWMALRRIVTYVNIKRRNKYLYQDLDLISLVFAKSLKSVE